ncbi:MULTISPECIES: EAL domain-containing response regulator [Pseudomonas]|uniref:cyclic-guanylate-specific phosphodiesterase n=1 Tax=Pseudomonas fluorescens LMG 5329 TaxID=1324332 RepID=A0A0A1Z001_PSEFL|nr:MULTISPECIES: EAL domain-containing response regulator [Pseudomonas]KGE66052.1 diguanylate cyclase [Pseudomonas fluorescens LMG 5329]NWE03391.1 EAL domain-containing response regulator [Pseudomonas sp. IPO3749]NWF19585.1 EAL domain-containing response regulator [Pseudomonas sp. IPO3749]
MATLLIVDDEPQVRKLLETLLHHEGYQTVSASSGEEALQVVAQQPPDLILLDIMMPGMDGYEVASQLKSDDVTAGIPIIMLSALSDPGARVSGLESGAEEFLSKPIERIELSLRVRNLLRLTAHGERADNLRQALQPDVDRRDLETALRQAVERNEFIVHYQPKVELATDQLCALEALLRWDRPGHGAVSPAVFVPVLESLGLIVAVGRWVIEAVCQQIATWQRSAIGAVEVSVNVSGHQLIEGDLIADIARILAQTGVEPHWLEVELTEGSLMENTQHTIASLQRLHAMGVKISIDDFGTGYSSLAYLRRFPIDTLKIDIAFIREVTSNPQDAAITRTIIELAHSLNLRVVAEGVETQAQLAFLKDAGCDQIQGYLFSRPLPVATLERLLLERSETP